MVPQEPVGEERSWPYFFLSHAHPAGSKDAHRPQPLAEVLVRRLYEQLCDHLEQLCPPILGEATPMGLMDSRIDVGEPWNQWLAEQLGCCRVFVPLLSPPYVHSDMCGREWAVFAERETWLRRGGTGAEKPSAIVPVQWAPFLGGMPEPAARLQYNRGDFPASYKKFGLYGLMARPTMKDDAADTIYLLAERIRDVAFHVRIAKGKPRSSLKGVRSAFLVQTEPRLPRIGRPDGDAPGAPGEEGAEDEGGGPAPKAGGIGGAAAAESPEGPTDPEDGPPGGSRPHPAGG